MVSLWLTVAVTVLLLGSLSTNVLDVIEEAWTDSLKVTVIAVLAVYKRVAHRKMALSEAAIPCLHGNFRLVKAGGYKPEARAKAISEVPRRPDKPSATRM